MNPFNWNTGEPSIFYTKMGHRIAQKQCASSGLVTDSNGRQVVNLGPRLTGGISLDPDVMASTAKTALLKKRKI